MALPLLNFQGLPQQESGFSRLLEGIEGGRGMFGRMDEAQQQKLRSALQNQMLSQQAADFPLEQMLGRDIKETQMDVMREQIAKSQLERELAPQELMAKMMQAQASKASELKGKALDYRMQDPEFVRQFYASMGMPVTEEESEDIAEDARRTLLPANLQTLEVVTNSVGEYLNDDRKQILLDAAKYAGSLSRLKFGKGTLQWDKTFNPDEYIKYEIARNQIMPALASQFKKLEQLGASEHQMEELKNMFFKAYDAPDPKRARQMLREGFKMLKDIEEANLRAIRGHRARPKRSEESEESEIGEESPNFGEMSPPKFEAPTRRTGREKKGMGEPVTLNPNYIAGFFGGLPQDYGISSILRSRR